MLGQIKEIEALLEACPSIRCVGVNGLDCAGKTTFADALYSSLSVKGLRAKLIHVDDYNNQPVQAEIYAAYEAGKFTPALFEKYYTSSVNYGALKEVVCRELQADSVIIIVEGVFLYKPSLVDLFDLKVFLPVDPAVAKMRYQERKIQIGDTRPVSVFEHIWQPAFERYSAECQPHEIADKVFSI